MHSKDEKAFCSFCDSTNVKLVAPFGTAQLVRQYFCNDCKTVFEYVKWRDINDTKN
jgi:formate dehydrogenase maturation protein FdhE